MRIKFFLLLFLVCFKNYAQETEFSKTSIKTGIGLGFGSGIEEDGIGLVYQIGWQKSYGQNERFRINPSIVYGGFNSFADDDNDQLFRMSILGLNIHYDLIRYESVSIVTTIGGFANYTRGLIGTGAEFGSGESKFFSEIYLGGNASWGFRIDNKKSKIAYELRPFNLYVGNKQFTLGYMMFGIDFKLRK